MSALKPHIKPKAEPCRRQKERPSRDVPPFVEDDPPVFTEYDSDAEQKTDERVLFYEDDCLR